MNNVGKKRKKKGEEFCFTFRKYKNKFMNNNNNNNKNWMTMSVNMKGKPWFYSFVSFVGGGGEDRWAKQMSRIILINDVSWSIFDDWTKFLCLSVWWTTMCKSKYLYMQNNELILISLRISVRLYNIFKKIFAFMTPLIIKAVFNDHINSHLIITCILLQFVELYEWHFWQLF